MGALAPLVLLILLAGCASGQGEYFSARPHVVLTSNLENSWQPSISTYHSLRSAVMNVISAGRTRDSIRINNYSGDLEQDLQRISNEMLEEYPLGVYGVSNLGFDLTQILSYQDVIVSVEYRRSPEELAKVIPVFNRYDLERRMNDVFAGFSEHAVFLVRDMDDGGAAFNELVNKSWLNAGRCAIGLSSVSVRRYPPDQTDFVAAISIQYTESRVRLLKKSSDLKGIADDVASQCMAQADKTKLRFIYDYLRSRVTLDEAATLTEQRMVGYQINSDEHTAYGALVNGTASQTGIVLAADLLCDSLDVDSTVIQGRRDDRLYTWLLVDVDGQPQFFDVTSLQRTPHQAMGERGESQPVFLYAPDDMRSTLSWNEAVYPLD